MLASKTFVKKTKKGAVVKVVREHYLRDDVWCGVTGCKLCKGKAVLDACAVASSELCPYPHLLLPDTNVVLHQTDFLEDAAVTDTIIVQTVLQEVSFIKLGMRLLYAKLPLCCTIASSVMTDVLFFIR